MNDRASRERDQFDRLDVQEFNRRLESMALRVGGLATEIAVFSSRETTMSEQMRKLQTSVEDLEETLAKGRGAVYILTISAGLVAGILGFWDKIPKPWSH